MKSTIKFASQEAIQAPEPKSSKTIFAVVIVITTVLSGFVAATGLIDDAWKIEVMAVLKALDAIVYGIGKLFGVVIEKE